MEKVFISFCRAGENIIEQIIKSNICSEFIHVEILTDDFAYDYSEQHGVEGKKKWNLIERMESESYKRNINEVFELNIPKDGLQKVYSFIEKYYQTHNYDKNMKVYKIGDLVLGNKEFIKGNLDITTTICSHFCFEVIRFIVENYYKENTSLIHKVGQINNHYKKKMEYITPGYLYKIFSKEDGFFLNKTETYKKNMEEKITMNEKEREYYESFKADKISDEDIRKGEEKSKNLGKNRNDFLILIEMLKAALTGKYELPGWAIVAIIGVITYVISPIDAVPDIIPVAGWLDDGSVVAGVVGVLAAIIKDYKNR